MRSFLDHGADFAGPRQSAGALGHHGGLLLIQHYLAAFDQGLDRHFVGHPHDALRITILHEDATFRGIAQVAHEDRRIPELADELIDFLTQVGGERAGTLYAASIAIDRLQKIDEDGVGGFRGQLLNHMDELQFLRQVRGASPVAANLTARSLHKGFSVRFIVFSLGFKSCGKRRVNDVEGPAPDLHSASRTWSTTCRSAGNP